MKNEENQEQFSIVSHSPWELLRASHIPPPGRLIVLSQSKQKGTKLPIAPFKENMPYPT
jgi:hypothetical protein